LLDLCTLQPWQCTDTNIRTELFRTVITFRLLKGYCLPLEKIHIWDSFLLKFVA
jgi:hypothetical protein